jgi:hypothetical protein
MSVERSSPVEMIWSAGDALSPLVLDLAAVMLIAA